MYSIVQLGPNPVPHLLCKVAIFYITFTSLAGASWQRHFIQERFESYLASLRYYPCPVGAVVSTPVAHGRGCGVAQHGLMEPPHNAPLLLITVAVAQLCSVPGSQCYQCYQFYQCQLVTANFGSLPARSTQNQCLVGRPALPTSNGVLITRTLRCLLRPMERKCRAGGTSSLSDRVSRVSRSWDQDLPTTGA